MSRLQVDSPLKYEDEDYVDTKILSHSSQELLRTLLHYHFKMVNFGLSHFTNKLGNHSVMYIA